MAELNDFVESLKKKLTCPICKEIFQDPITLPCLHSFCRECITGLKEASSDSQLRCPTCREEIDGETSSFQLKLMIKYLVHKMASTREEDQVLKCANCRKRSIMDVFCPKCEGMICTECFSAHQFMKVFEDHETTSSLIVYTQEDFYSYIVDQFHCEVESHENEKLQYFCEKCQGCICQTCFDTAHGDHKKISVEEKADEVKRSINEDLDRINLLKEKCHQDKQLSDQNLKRNVDEFNIAKKKRTDHVGAQMRILQNYERVTTTSLDEMFRKQKEANDEEQSEIDAAILQISVVKDQGEALQDENVAHFILQSQLPQRCEELLQRPPVLSSKPNQRNASVRYIPNTQVTLQDLGKVVQSVPDPSRCTIELDDDVIRCGFVNKFQIVTRNSREELCYTNKGLIYVEVKDEEGGKVETQLTESETGKFVGTFKAEKPSPHQILVSIGGKPIKNSPMKVKF